MGAAVAGTVVVVVGTGVAVAVVGYCTWPGSGEQAMSLPKLQVYIVCDMVGHVCLFKINYIYKLSVKILV